jgi:hypothetical protein
LDARCRCHGCENALMRVLQYGHGMFSIKRAQRGDDRRCAALSRSVRVDGWVGPLLTHSESTYVGHEPFSLW